MTDSHIYITQIIQILLLFLGDVIVLKLSVVIVASIGKYIKNHSTEYFTGMNCKP